MQKSLENCRKKHVEKCNFTNKQEWESTFKLAIFQVDTLDNCVATRANADNTLKSKTAQSRFILPLCTASTISLWKGANTQHELPLYVVMMLKIRMYFMIAVYFGYECVWFTLIVSQSGRNTYKQRQWRRYTIL